MENNYITTEQALKIIDFLDDVLDVLNNMLSDYDFGNIIDEPEIKTLRKTLAKVHDDISGAKG